MLGRELPQQAERATEPQPHPDAAQGLRGAPVVGRHPQVAREFGGDGRANPCDVWRLTSMLVISHEVGFEGVGGPGQASRPGLRR